MGRYAMETLPPFFSEKDHNGMSQGRYTNRNTWHDYVKAYAKARSQLS